MDLSEAQRRLRQLISDNMENINKAKIFRTIFENGGIVAGGAAVYCVDETVDINSVGDIDIFFTQNNRDGYNKTIRKFFTFFPNAYHAYNNCVITIYPDDIYEIKNQKPVAYQFIISEFKTAEGVISNFDLDYVQVAITKDRIVQTDVQRQSLLTHTISHGIAPLKIDRIIKAYRKGYNMELKSFYALMGIEWHQYSNDFEYYEKSTIRYWQYPSTLLRKHFTITKESKEIPLTNIEEFVRERYDGAIDIDTYKTRCGKTDKSDLRLLNGKKSDGWWTHWRPLDDNYEYRESIHQICVFLTDHEYREAINYMVNTMATRTNQPKKSSGEKMAKIVSRYSDGMDLNETKEILNKILVCYGEKPIF